MLSGCPCGSRFFFYFREGKILPEKVERLSEKERKEIESDVRDIIGTDFDESRPVILDLESIRVKKPGKFEIDLVSLFKRKPVIYRLEAGKYIIDLASTFLLHRQKGKK